MNRHDLTDFGWSVIEPLLRQKSRGVPRVDDRRVLNGIFERYPTGSPWANIPERYGAHTTCYIRFLRWSYAGTGAGMNCDRHPDIGKGSSEDDVH